MSDYLFIDIRKSDEVYFNRLDKSSKYDIYYIPMYMIRFNVDMIKGLNYKNIYIICYSGKRSQFIKDKYFSDNNNIFVSESLQFQNLSFGVNNSITLNDNYTIDVNVVGSNSFNIYSIMRITQIILGTLIVVIGIYTYSSLNKDQNSIPLFILLLFGFNALINGLTSTCTISDIFQNHLN